MLPLTGGTLTGDLSIGAHKLKTTDLSFAQVTAATMGLKDDTGTDYKNLKVDHINPVTALSAQQQGTAIEAQDVAARHLLFKARGAAALEEIARLQGAAAGAYFQATLPMRLLPTAAPGTPLEGHYWYDDTDKKLQYYDDVGEKVVGTANITTGTYTGDDTVNRAIPHGLGCVPKLVILRYFVASLSYFIFGGDTSIIYWGPDAAAMGGHAITTPTDTNFYVGNADNYQQSANSDTHGFKWVAFG